MNDYDVLIIGAGPAGATAGTLLRRGGHSVCILEADSFPRFCIGESLLPQCMALFEEAGMMKALIDAGFKSKDGAVFARGVENEVFSFAEKSSVGHSSTWQVPRAEFDQILADGAAESGCEIRYCSRVVGVSTDSDGVSLTVDTEGQSSSLVRGRFLLDASGYGRVLARLMDLELPSPFPVRRSIFTHVEDNITASSFDRDKILITIHPSRSDVWFWVIPFSDGRSSVGVIGTPEWLDAQGDSDAERLQKTIGQAPELQQILIEARPIAEVRNLTGYSADVSTLCGDRFAILGNAGEFLDPVFSSGVTIALKSSSLAVSVLLRQLRGENVDWSAEYEAPLCAGVEAFKAYVHAWYDGRLHKIFFSPNKQPEIRAMICSILAGYAWDLENPFVADAERRLNTLAQLCN